MIAHKSFNCPGWLQPPVLALQFLTRIPMPDIGLAGNSMVGRSLLFYPLVGLLIGLALWGGQQLLQILWPELWGLQAALLLALWCLLTGGLHLDGLADSADAWVGGFGDRERTLALMKDPTCGPAAVMLLVLLMLVKFSALQALLDSDPIGLIVAPLIARSLLLLLFLTTPYVRKGGLGDVLSRHFPRTLSWWLLVMLLVLLLFSGVGGGVWLLSLLCFLALRRLMLVRLGGTTGDTAGAMVEVVEASVLLGLLLA